MSWAPDAELHLAGRQATAGSRSSGVVRTPARRGRVARAWSARAARSAEFPIEVGAAFCATADGLAWIDAAYQRPRARHRAPLGRAPRAARRSPSRATAIPRWCAAITPSSSSATATTTSRLARFVPGSAPKPAVVAIRDNDFGDDDEREHDATRSATTSVSSASPRPAPSRCARSPRTGAPTPWRRLKQTVPPDDDIVAVDGDAEPTLIVFTHDADDACPGIGSTAEAVRALRVDRKTGAETVLDLAPADCNQAPGPFWIAWAPPEASRSAGWSA